MANRPITVNMDFDLKKISLDLSKELNLASGMVIKDISDKNKSGVDIHGQKLPALKKSTIKAKQKRNAPHPSRALFDTGRMVGKGSVKGTGGRGAYLSDRASKAKQVATISVAKNREDIGAYHNEGDGVPKREWFGISKKAEKDIFRMVELRIQEMIRRA